MQSKRILIPLLAVLLIALLAGTSIVSAAEADPFTVTVDVTCDDAVMAEPLVVQPGDTLTVSLAVKNNPGFMWLTMNLAYNTEVLELVSDDNGIVHTLNTAIVGELGEGEYTLQEDVPGNVYVALLPSDFAANADKDGEVITFSFKVKADVHGDLDFAVSDAKAYNFSMEALTVATGEDAAYVHTFTAAPKTEAATCTTPATKTYTCDDCDQDVVVIAGEAAGHNVTSVPAKNPTCDEEGNIAHFYCEACDGYFTDAAAAVEIQKANTVLAAAGHSTKEVAAKTATCTEDGNIACWQCETCDKYFSEEAATTELAAEDVVTTAPGHNYQVVAGTAATCTTDGLTDGEACTVCGDVKTAQEVITSEGHKLVTLPRVEPDGKTPGLTEGKQCSVCGLITLQQEPIEPTSLAWLWILIIVVVVAAAGVVAYFFIFKKKVKRY
ncbi:MAG: hypothetical protein IJ012_07490 [Clostridia bacterium]|nr:hypothetical protein [Clostridia bacterium]